MFRGLLSILIMVTLLPLPRVDGAQVVLPLPGTMVHVSPRSATAVLRGLKVHPEDPFRFEFILDYRSETSSVAKHESNLAKEDYLKKVSTRLIKYFLAGITVPEKDLWVNLSPYEKDRIVPDSFGKTQMGRDLLAQDYLLKQLTASLVYPEGEIGKEFWKKVYEISGSKNVSVNTFNKVWIVPDKAVVYENVKAGTVYVVESNLKVLFEQDYLAMEKHAAAGGAEAVRFARSARGSMASSPATPRGDGWREDERNSSATGSAAVVRALVIPQLTKEVNEGSNFAQLRQVYNSLILATWYKRKIKNSILAQVYANKNKIKGTEYTNSVITPILPTPQSAGRDARTQVDKAHTLAQPNDVEGIYQRYLEAFKKGAYNYIKEEQDPATLKVTPRKYFAGGVKLGDLAMTSSIRPPHLQNERLVIVDAGMNLPGLTLSDYKIITQKFERVNQAMSVIFRILNYLKSDLNPWNTERFWKELEPLIEQLLEEESDLEVLTKYGGMIRDTLRKRGVVHPNQYLSRIVGMMMLTDPTRIDEMLARQEALLAAPGKENVMERLTGNWQKVYDALHLGLTGPHAEKDAGDGKIRYIDNDRIKMAIRQLLGDLISADHNSGLNAHPQLYMSKQKAKFNYRQLMYWGVAVMINPLLNDYMLKPQEVFPDDPQQNKRSGLKRWPDGPAQAMEEFIRDATSNVVVNKGFEDERQASNEEEDNLLSEIFRTNWAALGLRSPWDVFIYDDTVEEKDRHDVLGLRVIPPDVKYLEDQMFDIVAPHEHYDDTGISMHYFPVINRPTYAPGLAAYMYLADISYVKEHFPGLVGAVTALDVNGSAAKYMKKLQARSISNLDAYQKGVFKNAWARTMMTRIVQAVRGLGGHTISEQFRFRNVDPAEYANSLEQLLKKVPASVQYKGYRLLRVQEKPTGERKVKLKLIKGPLSSRTFTLLMHGGVVEISKDYDDFQPQELALIFLWLKDTKLFGVVSEVLIQESIKSQTALLKQLVLAWTQKGVRVPLVNVNSIQGDLWSKVSVDFRYLDKTKIESVLHGEPEGPSNRRLFTAGAGNDGAMASASKHTGGIDFNPAGMDLSNKAMGGSIAMRVSPAMIARLRDAEGLYPVVFKIIPLPTGAAGTRALWDFLGVPQ